MIRVYVFFAVTNKIEKNLKKIKTLRHNTEHNKD